MGLDVIDFTDLQKRGLIKVPEEKDVVDFTAESKESSSLEQSNPFDMLSSLAQVEHKVTPSNDSDLNIKLDTIVNKLEDTMYKIETLNGRIAAIESKIDSISWRS